MHTLSLSDFCCLAWSYFFPECQMGFEVECQEQNFDAHILLSLNFLAVEIKKERWKIEQSEDLTSLDGKNSHPTSNTVFAKECGPSNRVTF